MIRNCILCAVAPAPHYSENINRQASFACDGVFENGQWFSFIFVKSWVVLFEEYWPLLTEVHVVYVDLYVSHHRKLLEGHRNLFQQPFPLLTYLLHGAVLLEKLTGFAASQEIIRILWNTEVHYLIHKCPPPVPILSQHHPVSTPSHFLKIHLNIILPSTSGSPQWSLSLGLPH